MSDLEGRAKTLLTDVIIDGKQTSFAGDDLKFLAAYAFEKSVVANYQTLRILGEPISTRAHRERFRTSLAIPANVRIWISSFQGQSRYSGRSNPRYAKSTNDPPPLNDLDVFTHTYVIGHLVFQVLSSPFNSILNRGSRGPTAGTRSLLGSGESADLAHPARPHYVAYKVIERTSTKARWERTLAPAEVHFSNPIPCETGTACEVLKQ